jgi:hypothetical protein
MITGRALLNLTRSRVLFALGVLGVIGVIACHSVTLDRDPVVTLSDGPTVHQVIAVVDGVEVWNTVGPWELDMSEVPLAMPSPLPDHSEAACAAFLTGSLLLLGWAACRLIAGKRQLAPRRTAIFAPAAHDSGGWRVLSPAKLGILRI